MNHHGVACTASHLLLGCWCRDGLGGVVKRRLREDITNGMRDGKTVDIKTARGCYDHIDSTLGSEDWAKKHASFKVSRFKCVWGTTDDFNRPADKNKDEYHPLTGCRESRQFLAMRESIVCHRSFACWCRACLHSKGGSGLDGGKSLNGSVRFAVHQCASSSQDSRMWTELDVSKSTAAASAVTRASAQAKGKEIAGSAKVGEHVIAQTRSDDTDQFALGVFVDAGKGSPVIAQATKRGKLQTKFGSVFCNDGDVVLAVRWLVRDESDAERRTFYEPSDEDEAGSVIPVNSTELRHAGFGLTVLEPSIRTACNAELESDVEDVGDVNGEDEWEDDDGESGDEVIDDHIEEDSAYVHGRRVVLSVADEQTALDRCW